MEFGLDFNLGIEGLQKAQEVNLKALAALRPEKAAGEAIRYIIAALSRYAIGITHAQTGALRASHRTGYFHYRGIVTIDSGAVNPLGQRVADYAEHEHARGGTHAFYDRTVREAGSKTMRTGLRILDLGVAG